VPDGANSLTKNLAHSPVALRDVPDPQLLHDDWVITRPRLTGICGSDSKQILLDFGEGDADNAMAAFCSFPQVMGHEVVADVVSLGPKARGVDVGQRVVLNPWLSCGRCIRMWRWRWWRASTRRRSAGQAPQIERYVG
jgi:threonine dehydrogenase-like Zn-dependent dehydrogenase